MRSAILALALGLIGLPSLALADDGVTTTPPVPPTSPEVVTSAGGGAPVAAQSGDNSLARWLADEPTIIDLNNRQAGDLTAPRAVHGYVSVGAGTNGYRDVAAGAVMPVGKTGELGVAVEDEQFKIRHHNYEQKNLAVSLAFGQNSPPPADCASAIRVGDHYVEPLWATQIRGHALADADPRCLSEPLR